MQKPDFISRRDFALLCEKFSGEELERAVGRLEDREPLAYVLGEWYFRNETYFVSPEVLVPRPETELLVEKVVRLAPTGGRIADICTGSGCIAISSLCERPDITALAVDISDGALGIAKRNAELNRVGDRIGFEKGDVLNGLSLDGKFDIIVSNPPYIRRDIIGTLEPEVRCEPYIALDGGEDGLDFYPALVKLESSLKDGGWMIFEIGYDQKDALEAMGFTVENDYSSLPRVAFKQFRRSDG